MPPKSPAKSRTVKALALDHPGPAWAEPASASKRRTPARTRPEDAKAASPIKPAATTPAAAESAAERDAVAAEPARKLPKASPAKKVAKPLPVTVAKTAKKQLADDGLGDYWTATPQSRRKLAGGGAPARANSPVAARPGSTPPKAFQAADAYDDDDEPIATVGGGWLINKMILSCLICTLASALEHAAVRRAPVQLAAVGIFAGWGAISGAISTLWAKLLGWATESMQVGLRRTVLTTLVDQLLKAPAMAIGFVAYTCAMGGSLTERVLVAQLERHLGPILVGGLLMFLGAYALNPRVPHTHILVVCRLEQLAHSVYLATFCAQILEHK